MPEITINPIITSGHGFGKLVITQGYGGYYEVQLVIILSGTTSHMIRNPIPNLNFRINGEIYTFTRQLRSNVLGANRFQGWCYACTFHEIDTITIEMPLFLDVIRPDGRKPDIRFSFIKWHNPDTENRVITITMTEDMEPLIVEFAVKGEERRGACR